MEFDVNSEGFYGEYGGAYIPEMLYPNIKELEENYLSIVQSEGFQSRFRLLLRDYAGRPTPLFRAERLSEHYGTQIFLKREDLNHTGAHKANNVMGQGLLVKRMGKTRVIAETGAGQHGVATAAVCAKFGLECVIYMGSVDMERQALNVFRMRLCGAEVRAVEAGQKTLKEAINEAMRDWVTNVDTTHYILGSALGSHPYPMMVRDFHRVIGREARAQILEREGRLPDELIACVGGGSNAIGLFFDFLDDQSVRLTGVEAGGHGIEKGEHAARFEGGRLGVLQGCKTYILQNRDGQIELTHSVSAGLDYAAIGPEHAYYRDQGRIDYAYATDTEVLEAFQLCCRTEGIIPALESTHALVHVIRRARELGPEKIILMNLSGRGDKDVQQVAALLGETPNHS